MKKLSRAIILLLLLFDLTARGQYIVSNISQSDSAYYCSFFPMHVGDRWVYKVDPGDGSEWYYYYEIVMDTVDCLNRHWYGRKSGSSSNLGFYMITDSFEVVYGTPDSITTTILYKLNANPGDKWLIYGNYEQGIVFEVDTIYDYGKGIKVMKIDEWNWDNYERTLWSSSRFLKTGIGLNEIWWEVGPSEYLVGAIVNGVIYGDPNEIEHDRLTLPHDLNLCQNFPNPFNIYTTITFYLNQRGVVSFSIYNIIGRLILTRKYCYSEGYNTIMWDGTDKNNRPVSSGVYIYELSKGKDKMRMKMTLNK